MLACSLGFLCLLLLALAAARLAPGWLEGGRALAPERRLTPPAPGLWLGTDALGRDLLARLALAGPNSLAVASAAALLAVVPGAFLGAAAALHPWADGLLMRLADALLAVPALVLALALVTLFGAGPAGLIPALAIPELPRVLRLVRALALTAAAEPWYQAARGIGAGPWARLMRHLAPALAGSLLAVLAQVFAVALLVEALLGFLGLGLPSENPGWGSLLAEGRDRLRTAPWLVLAPGACIALAVFASQLLADALQHRLALLAGAEGERGEPR